MNILDIYDQYQIPPQLQRHQLEVAAVGMYVIDHWQGPKIHKKPLLETLLLHDMGNIVKFKRPFLGEMEKDAKHWEQVQREFFTKYGKETHVVTLAVLKEIGVGKETQEIVRQMGYAADGKLYAERWEAKIADFADTCVTPKGIEGFEIRIQDLITRYHLPEGTLKVQAWRDNAAEVQENVDVELSEVAAHDFSKAIFALKETEILTTS